MFLFLPEGFFILTLGNCLEGNKSACYNICLSRVNYCLHLAYLLGTLVVVLHGLLEVVPGGIKFFLGYFHVFVRLFHAFSLIIFGSSCNHCNELFLPFGLDNHISFGKEGRSDRIAQHVLLEGCDNGINSLLSSYSFIEGGHRIC